MRKLWGEALILCIRTKKLLINWTPKTVFGRVVSRKKSADIVEEQGQSLNVVGTSVEGFIVIRATEKGLLGNLR